MRQGDGKAVHILNTIKVICSDSVDKIYVYASTFELAL